MTKAFQLVGEVELDGRRRISLGGLRLASDPNARYRVEEGPRGELRLTPVYSVSDEELELLSDRQAMERINENIDGEFVTFDPVAALGRLDEIERAEVAD